MTEEGKGQISPEDLEDGTENVEQVTECCADKAEAASASTEAADLLAELTLEEQLKEIQAQAAEYLDGWQRARAEFANFRRRQEQQQKQQDIAAKSRVLIQLLPVVDDLERAFCAVPEDLEDHPWVSGLSLVEGKWLAALEKLGLSAVAAEPGDAFNPACHQALTHEPNDEFEEGAVIEVLQRGYETDGVILRPALVRVSSGKTEAKSEQTTSDTSEGA